MLFWEILKDIYYNDYDEDKYWQSEAGIIRYDHVSGELAWDDNGEPVYSGYDDLDWEELGYES